MHFNKRLYDVTVQHVCQSAGIEVHVRKNKPKGIALYFLLESFSALYEVGSKLGSGLAGTVHEGICRSDDQKVETLSIQQTFLP